MILVTTPPTLEPVTLDEVKAQLRLDHSEDDDFIAAKIKAARQNLERRCGIAMLSQTVKFSADGFPAGPLMLPRPPLPTVTSIVYRDATHAAVTLAAGDYIVRGVAGDGFVAPVTSWPATDGLSGAVEATFVAGYGATAADVPEPLREAVRLLAAYLYDRGEAASSDAMHELPFGVEDMVADFRRWGFG